MPDPDRLQVSTHHFDLVIAADDDEVVACSQQAKSTPPNLRHQCRSPHFPLDIHNLAPNDAAYLRGATSKQLVKPQTRMAVDGGTHHHAPDRDRLRLTVN